MKHSIRRQSSQENKNRVEMKWRKRQLWNSMLFRLWWKFYVEAFFSQCSTRNTFFNTMQTMVCEVAERDRARRCVNAGVENGGFSNHMNFEEKFELWTNFLCRAWTNIFEKVFLECNTFFAMKCFIWNSVASSLKGFPSVLFVLNRCLWKEFFRVFLFQFSGLLGRFSFFPFDTKVSQDFFLINQEFRKRSFPAVKIQVEDLFYACRL